MESPLLEKNKCVCTLVSICAIYGRDTGLMAFLNIHVNRGQRGGVQAFVIALFIASWLRAMAHMKYYQDDDMSQPNSKLWQLKVW